VKDILRQELGFQGIVFSDDLNMSGAAQAGSVDERASLALRAGCDVILLCNDRGGTEQLLTRLEPQIEPLTQVRLMRMHGKRNVIYLAELHSDEKWITASDKVARINQTRVLDLGDDMLS
jgi:beta-N-acetylhexosaminidase